MSYRLRVIKALVQRYIETARREFEETRRKGQRLTCNALPLAHLGRVPTPDFPPSILHTIRIQSRPLCPRKAQFTHLAP